MAVSKSGRADVFNNPISDIEFNVTILVKNQRHNIHQLIIYLSGGE